MARGRQYSFASLASEKLLKGQLRSEVMKSRKERVKRVCQKYGSKLKRPLNVIYKELKVYKKRQLAYCGQAKVS